MVLFRPQPKASFFFFDGFGEWLLSPSQSLFRVHTQASNPEVLLTREMNRLLHRNQEEVSQKPTKTSGFGSNNVQCRPSCWLFKVACRSSGRSLSGQCYTTISTPPKTGVIILTVSGGYQSQKMWVFPVNPPLTVGGNFDHGNTMKPEKPHKPAFDPLEAQKLVLLSGYLERSWRPSIRSCAAKWAKQPSVVCPKLLCPGGYLEDWCVCVCVCVCVGGWVGGWVEGWVGGWVGGCEVKWGRLLLGRGKVPDVELLTQCLANTATLEDWKNGTLEQWNTGTLDYCSFYSKFLLLSFPPGFWGRGLPHPTPSCHGHLESILQP